MRMYGKGPIAISLLIAALILTAVILRYERPKPDDRPQTGFTVPVVEANEPITRVKHLETPKEVRGLYWTAQTAGSDERRKELLTYMLERGINAVVIDVKMDDGEIAFEPKNDSLKPFAQEHPAIADLEAMLNEVGEAGIYRIARIPVMRDGAIAIKKPDLVLRRSDGGMWQDNIGSLWVDPAADDVSQTALLLALEAYARGFDEIQYDYVRFPSDGRLSSIAYPFYDASSSTKAEVMERVFSKLGDPLLKEHIPVSFDLFGMTFVSIYDMEIGQRLPDAYPHAAYLSPMAYPSHYPAGFRGIEDPAIHPYEIIKQTLDEGAAILETQFGIPKEASRPKFRPWIQDFDIGAVYTADLIEAQIRAARDAGASGFLIWNARNVYEPARYE